MSLFKALCSVEGTITLELGELERLANSMFWTCDSCGTILSIEEGECPCGIEPEAGFVDGLCRASVGLVDVPLHLQGEFVKFLCVVAHSKQDAEMAKAAITHIDTHYPHLSTEDQRAVEATMSGVDLDCDELDGFRESVKAAKERRGETK